MYVCPSCDYSNNGPTHTSPPRGKPPDPTDPRITNNVNKNSAEAIDATPILFQVDRRVIFHPDEPSFTPPIITYGAGCPALPARASTTLAAHAITKTPTSVTATLESIGIGKINSNHAITVNIPNATPRLTANPNSDVTLAISSGERDGNT